MQARVAHRVIIAATLASVASRRHGLGASRRARSICRPQPGVELGRGPGRSHRSQRQEPLGSGRAARPRRVARQQRHQHVDDHPGHGRVNNTVVTVPGRPDRHRLERHRGRVPDHRRPIELHLQHDGGPISGWRTGAASETKVPCAQRLPPGSRTRGDADRPAALRDRLPQQQGRRPQLAWAPVTSSGRSSTRRSPPAIRPTASRRSATGSSSPTPSRTPRATIEIPGAGQGVR